MFSHRLQCDHTVSSMATSLPCGTNCACPGSEDATNPPFLCTSCFEIHYLTGYFAVKARFRAEYPDCPWTILDEIKVGKILSLCALLEQHILERVPGLRECVGNIGTLLCKALTEEGEDEGSASAKPDYERYEDWVTEYLKWMQEIVWGISTDPEMEDMVVELTIEVKTATTKI